TRSSASPSGSPVELHGAADDPSGVRRELCQSWPGPTRLSRLRGRPARTRRPESAWRVRGLSLASGPDEGDVMRKSSLAVLGGTALLAACSSSLAPSLGGPAKTGDPAGGDAGGSPYRGSDGGISVTSALRPITSCSDLTVALHDDARAKMNASIDAQMKSTRPAAAAAQDAGGVYFGPDYGGGGGLGGGFAAGQTGAAVAAPPQANAGAT